MVLGALATLLEIEGDITVVGRSRNGADALNAVLTHKPDIFLTDIEMPEMSGLDVAAALKRKRCSTRTIILTTFARAGYCHLSLAPAGLGVRLKNMPPEKWPAPF